MHNNNNNITVMHIKYSSTTEYIYPPIEVIIADNYNDWVLSYTSYTVIQSVTVYSRNSLSKPHGWLGRMMLPSTNANLPSFACCFINLNALACHLYFDKNLQFGKASTQVCRQGFSKLQFMMADIFVEL